MWSYFPEDEAFGWHTMNSRVGMSQKEIKSNTRQAQAEAVPEETQLWTPEMNFAQGNYMRVSARRDFDQKGTDRDFKLTDVKKWSISFFDMSGAHAFSTVFDLNLSSTPPKIKPKSEVKTEVAPVKPEPK